MFYDRNPESMRTVSAVCPPGRDFISKNQTDPPDLFFFVLFFRKISGGPQTYLSASRDPPGRI